MNKYEPKDFSNATDEHTSYMYKLYACLLAGFGLHYLLLHPHGLFCWGWL